MSQELAIFEEEAATGLQVAPDDDMGVNELTMPTVAPDFAGKACEETTGMVGETYTRCGAPAVMLVKYRGREEGPYFMCFGCGTHNARNRNAEVLAELPERTPLTIAKAESEQTSQPLMQILPADFPLPALIKFCPNPQLKVALDEAIAYALSLEIKGGGKEALATADLAVTALSDAIKAFEADFEDAASLANRLHKQITSARSEGAAAGKQAKDTIGRAIYAELKRLTDADNERRRKEQDAANQLAREQAAADAKAAEKNKAPKQVVEQLQKRVETAVAPPVPVAAPVKMASTSVVTTWKARIKGTPADADPNPDMAEITPEQRAEVLALMADIIKGTQPITCLELNWQVMNGRAKSDKGTLAITGIEAYADGGVRSKGSRSRS